MHDWSYGCGAKFTFRLAGYCTYPTKTSIIALCISAKNVMYITKVETREVEVNYISATKDSSFDPRPVQV